MARGKKRDAWVATIKVSVPIDATDTSTINVAQQKVRELANYIPGSTVEVTHAGFGRMAVGAMTPREAADARIAAERALEPPLGGMTAAMAEIKAQVQATNEPEIPEYLRRVPRRVDGNGTPLDPSGDGSFRGPDGAA